MITELIQLVALHSLDFPQDTLGEKASLRIFSSLLVFLTGRKKNKAVLFLIRKHISSVCTSRTQDAIIPVPG
jgi:hypothetical protein